MDERGAARQRIGTAARHFLWRDQFRFVRMPGLVDGRTRGSDRRIKLPVQPVRLQRMHAGHLGRWIADVNALREPVRQRR
jgi:hypothetical protein